MNGKVLEKKYNDLLYRIMELEKKSEEINEKLKEHFKI